MSGTQPSPATLRSEILDQLVARFVAMPPNGIEPPDGPDRIQLRIGTLVAETSWPEICELTGIPDAKGNTAAVTAAFAAIEAASRQRHTLTKRLMIRVWEKPGLDDRLMERFLPGRLDRSRATWLVWGDGAEQWREEP